MQSLQQLQINDAQNNQETNYIETKVDDSTSSTELSTFSENTKDISSPTQPKTLQQEFSLINMNIPNIEVI